MSIVAGVVPEPLPEPAAERRADNVIPLNVAGDVGRQDVVAWAHAALAEAEQRIAELQARIDLLESLSMTDELTGLLNRRGFLAQLDRALSAARRGGLRGAVMFCDLNGFKGVNDRFGHQAGDVLLCQIGSLLQRHLRGADTVARLGGDEFAILLAGASEAAAKRKAQALRQAIALTPFPICANLVHIRASFGVAAFTGPESAEALLDTADRGMYGDKRRASTMRTRRYRGMIGTGVV